MSEKIAAMIEEIKALSVLELSELVHALEETFGVSAAGREGYHGPELQCVHPPASFYVPSEKSVRTNRP